jgi:hypothetical protein
MNVALNLRQRGQDSYPSEPSLMLNACLTIYCMYACGLNQRMRHKSLAAPLLIIKDKDDHPGQAQKIHSATFDRHVVKKEIGAHRSMQDL